MPVAIHGNLGNPPITDASAIPSDVTVGKVFYNNDGRQVGTGYNRSTTTVTLPYTENWNDRCNMWVDIDTYEQHYTSGMYDGIPYDSSDYVSIEGNHRIIDVDYNQTTYTIVNRGNTNVFLAAAEGRTFSLIGPISYVVFCFYPTELQIYHSKYQEPITFNVRCY